MFYYFYITVEEIVVAYPLGLGLSSFEEGAKLGSSDNKAMFYLIRAIYTRKNKSRLT